MLILAIKTVALLFAIIRLVSTRGFMVSSIKSLNDVLFYVELIGILSVDMFVLIVVVLTFVMLSVVVSIDVLLVVFVLLLVAVVAGVGVGVGLVFAG